MNLIKCGLLFGFGVLTAICVSYAHSEALSLEDGQALRYTSSHPAILGTCHLTVQRQGNSLIFVAGENVLTPFSGPWAPKPGVVELHYGIDSDPVNATIEITFKLVNGQVQPTGYQYRSHNPNLPSRIPMFAPPCSGLMPERR